MFRFALCVLFCAPLAAQAAPEVKLPRVTAESAQAAKRVQLEEQVPFLVTEVDGKPAWKLRGAVEVSLDELLRLWVQATGQPLAVVPQQLKYNVSYFAPDAGVTFSGPRLTEFVADMLAQARFALVGLSAGRPQVVPMSEACSSATVVDRAELQKTQGGEWVTWYAVLRHADANALRAALQNLLTRQGGIMNPVSGTNAVAITDRAERVRQLARLCEALDVAPSSERTLESYELPEGKKADDVAAALRALLKPPAAPQQRGQDGADIGVVPGQNRLLVRGTVSQHAEVKRALELMK